MKKKIIALGMSISITTSIAFANPIDPRVISQESSFFKKTKTLTPITLIRKGVGKNNVVQGLTLDNQNQVLYSLNVTGNPEKGVLNRFKISNQFIWTALDAQKPSPYIGHQGISFDALSQTIYSSAGSAVENKGWHIVQFKYQKNRLPENINIIRVFNDAYNKNLNTMPSISPDGKLLVVRGKQGKYNVIRTYNFNQVRNQKDLTSSFVKEWKVDLDLTENGQPFQAMTTDGKYVYMLSGKGDHAPKRLYIYTIDGQLVQKVNNVQLGLAQAKLMGTGQLWEPEGLAIDTKRKQLIFMYAVGDSKQRKAHLYSVDIH